MTTKPSQYNVKAPAGALVYSLREPDAREGYHVCKLDVGRESYSSHSMVSLRFQATKKDAGPDGALDFYGFSVEVGHSTDSPEKLLDAAQLIAKLCKRHDAAGRLRDKPDQWRETLREAKAIEVAHDSRTSEYVRVETMAPDGWYSWRDDWHVMGRSGGCTLAAFARDEDEARAQMIVSAKTEHHYGGENFFEQWKAAGFPVIKLDDYYYGYKAPVTWAQVLYLNGVKIEAREECGATATAAA